MIGRGRESEEQSQDLAGSSQTGLTVVFTLVPNQDPRCRGLWVISGLQPYRLGQWGQLWTSVNMKWRVGLVQMRSGC